MYTKSLRQIMFFWLAAGRLLPNDLSVITLLYNWFGLKLQVSLYTSQRLFSLAVRGVLMQLIALFGMLRISLATSAIWYSSLFEDFLYLNVFSKRSNTEIRQLIIQ
jgi:hypothetical protein